MPNPLMSMLGGGSNPMTAMMQNSPIGKIVSLMRSGGNPQFLVQEMAGQNPQFRQIMEMTNGKTPTEMGGMINQLAQQRGVNVGDLANQIGMPEDVKAKLGIK